MLKSKLSKKIIGICGSPLGEKSKCYELLSRALREARNNGVSTEIHDMSVSGTVLLKERLKEADGFIIATPVHWFNVSVLIKQFIDETLYNFSAEPYELEGKPVGIIAVCNEDGGNQAIANIAMPLNHCGVFVPPFGTLFYNRSMPEHGEGGWQEEVEWIGKVVADYIENDIRRTR